MFPSLCDTNLIHYIMWSSAHELFLCFGNSGINLSSRLSCIQGVYKLPLWKYTEKFARHVRERLSKFQRAVGRWYHPLFSTSLHASFWIRSVAMNPQETARSTWSSLSERNRIHRSEDISYQRIPRRRSHQDYHQHVLGANSWRRPEVLCTSVRVSDENPGRIFVRGPRAAANACRIRRSVRRMRSYEGVRVCVLTSFRWSWWQGSP